MNWELAIERNREALQRIVAALFAMAGLAGDLTTATLPRHLRNHVLRVLRPAESAVRRLVVIAARGLVVTVKPRQAGARPGPGTKPSREPAARVPPLPLLDTLPDLSFRPFRRRPKGFPRISIVGVTEPRPIPEYWIPSPGDPVGAAGIRRRLHALQRALKDIDSHAKRFARWRARRDLRFRQTDRLPGRYSPLRPGRPPGHRKRAIHEIDEVLRECHSLALCAMKPPNTS